MSGGWTPSKSSRCISLRVTETRLQTYMQNPVNCFAPVLYLVTPPVRTPRDTRQETKENRLWQVKHQYGLRTALFWILTQRVVVISYRRFGRTYRFNLKRSKIQSLLFSRPLNMVVPETSVIIYQYSPRNNFVTAGRVEQYAYYHIPKSANTACTTRS